MGDKINLALIGAGNWGANLARVFHELGVLRIICDSSEKILLKNSAQYPGIITTNSYLEVLTSPEINAVVIATPAEQHYFLAKKALLSDKHVFVEKPLSITAQEGEDLVNTSKKKNRILFVGHILQYHLAVKTVKKMLQIGELGKLQYIYSNRLNLGKIRREENILWSFAPHDISVILSLVGEEPVEVTAAGTNILHPEIADTTVTNMKFPSGVGAHIFVSWLHPFKEQKMVIIGDRKMIVFDDTAPISQKLILYPHQISWEGGIPIPEKKDGSCIDLSKNWVEPLTSEGRAFINAINGQKSLTDAEEGLRVLKVLQRAQTSMDKINNSTRGKSFFIHESSLIDEDCQIGTGTKIWHFSHILKNTQIGKNANIGQNVVIGPNVKVGNNVKIQNNVSVYPGVTLEDNVFCGPSCVFTNVINPRSSISRKNEILHTLVREGATIGANSTILCGITIGKHAFIGAGSVVTQDVQANALVYRNPAKFQGWVCDCGCKLDEKSQCSDCGKIIKTS